MYKTEFKPEDEPVVKCLAMKEREFVAYLNSICPHSEHAADGWCGAAENMEKLESDEGEKPAGTYETADIFLYQYYKLFRTVREIYGEEIVRKVIALGNRWHYCIFPWEIFEVADWFESGALNAEEEIWEVQNEGYLEDETKYQKLFSGAEKKVISKCLEIGFLELCFDYVNGSVIQYKDGVVTVKKSGTANEEWFESQVFKLIETNEETDKHFSERLVEKVSEMGHKHFKTEGEALMAGFQFIDQLEHNGF